MKKLAAILMAVMLLASFTACEKEKQSQDQSSSSAASEIASEIISTSSQGNQSEYTEIIDIPDKEIYINYLKTKVCDKTANNRIVYKNPQTTISFVYDINNAYSGDLSGVVDFLDEKFVNRADSYCDGVIYGSKINIEKTESVKINGFDSIKFTGKTRCNADIDFHTYGYAFIIDNTPCMVVGIVATVAQEQSMIDELNLEIDEMAKTIRTEE